MAEDDKKNQSFQGSFGNHQYSIEERDFLQKELLKKLDTEAISKRQGPNGQYVHYIETWKAIELANLTFGFNGWSSRIMEINNDYIEQTQQGKFNCGVSAIIRVSLKDGSFHEDIGYGASDNQKHRGAAYEQAKKTAVSDGLKRALRNFGNALGLTIYDREHLKQMGKVKKSPAGASNQPKPTNPYFSQTSPTQTSVINATQHNLESLAAMEFDPSQPLTTPKRESQDYDNLNIDDDVDISGDNNGHSPQQPAATFVPPTTTKPPVFQPPSQSPGQSQPPVFQRPKRPTGGAEPEPSNQPSLKKNKM